MSQRHAPQRSGCFVVGWVCLVCALPGHYLAASEYQADSPTPANNDMTVNPSNVLLTWTPAQQASSQMIYLGTSPNVTYNRIATLSGATGSYFYSFGFELGQTYYWRIDTLDQFGALHTGETWSFTTLSYQASQPGPEPGTQWVAPQNTALTWQSGLLAVSHEVYFGTAKEAVKLGFSSVYLGLVVGTGQLQYALPPLEKGTTYYWRIDERQSSGLVTQGNLWQFTTLASDGGIQGRYFDNAYLGEDPVLTRIDKGVNLNFAQDNLLRRVLTPDDAFSVRWTGQLFLPQSNEITLIVTANDCVRLCVDGQTVIDDWTAQPARQLSITLPPSQGTLAEIVLEYAHIQGEPRMQLFWSHDRLESQIIPSGPLQPFSVSHLPKPAHGDQNINHSPRLSWQSGTTAASHELYLGTNSNSVARAQPNDAEFLARQNTTSYDLADLSPNQTYYWRVDDVNFLNQPNVTTGRVWQFSTANYYVIDDFEAYANAPSQRIFEAWVDGWGYQKPLPGQPGNNTGATVGHFDLPYAEQDIVHTGCQSMPLAYQNNGRYQHSEATHTFAVPLSMTVQQNRPLRTLSVAFHGQPASAGQFSKQQNTFILTGTGTGFWQENDRCYFVSQSVSGSVSISARIERLDEIHALSQAGIMIRQSNEPNASQACIAITADGRLAYHYRSNPGQPVLSQYSEPDTVTLPHWVKLQRQGAALSLSHSQDGLTWLPVTLDNQPYMSLSGFASLGLMHCVYKDNLTTGTAMFTQVTSTSVAPFNAASGLGIPVNEADDLYLLLEDDQGNPSIEWHPENPEAVLKPQWQTWNVNLSSFSGINMDAIKSLTIGIGSPDNLKPGGEGVIFIDDIGLHP